MWLSKLYLHLFFVLIILISNNGYCNPNLAFQSHYFPKLHSKIAPDFIFNSRINKKVLPKHGSSIKGKHRNQRLHINKIQIKGNTVLTRTQLVPVLKNYVGNSITTQQLNQLRFEITQLYLDLGYVNSTVILPDQTIENGTVVFQAIEGQIEKIYVSGNKSLSTSFFSKTLNAENSQPLNIKQLKNKVNELKGNPQIESIHAELFPGRQPGRSQLKINVVEKKPYQIKIGLDNYRSPTIGAERGSVFAVHNNITGQSDSLAGQFGLTQGLTDYSLKYTFPIKLLHSKLSTYYINSDATLIDNSINLNDIESKSTLIGFSWLLEGNKNHNSSYFYSAGYENSSSETTINGTGVGGCNLQGLCESNVLFIGANWQHKSNFFQNQGAVTARRGLGITSSNSSTDAIDPEFTALLTQFYMTSAIRKFNAMFRLNSKLQYALDKLAGNERLSIGGAMSVRGYRENSVVSDNGFLLSTEWVKKAFIPKTYVTTFIDYGVGWNKLLKTKKEHLLSFGAGIGWHGIKSFNSELFVGVPLLQRPDELDNLQDYGVHFNLQYRIF